MKKVIVGTEIIHIQKHETFYAVAYTSLREIDRLVEQRRAALRRIHARRAEPTEDERDIIAASEATEERLAVTTVIFSALALEAFINDYGLSSLRKDHFERLDRLSPVGKWLVLPWIVTGNRLSSSGRAFSSLKGLFGHRNRLAHFKSEEKPVSKLKPGDRYTQKEASEAVTTVRVAVTELRHVDEKIDTGWVSEAQKLPPREGETVKQLGAL